MEAEILARLDALNAHLQLALALNTSFEDSWNFPGNIKQVYLTSKEFARWHLSWVLPIG
jgi:hypothetical protein